jgi:cytoskeletal protein CcmA (bactofilin family)
LVLFVPFIFISIVSTRGELTSLHCKRVERSRSNPKDFDQAPTALLYFKGGALSGRQLMFNRSSPQEPSKLSARLNSVAIASVPQQHRTGPTDSGDKSIIGNDLKIIGQGGLKIISRGILQIDGEIEGDVQAAEVIIGAQGKVMGLVAGQQVTVSGKVSGAICARTVTLQSTSEVEGDIHHLAFAIEQGAVFEGRSRRAGNEADLNAVIEAKGGQSKSA